MTQTESSRSGEAPPALVDILAAAQSVLVIMHDVPDGDTIGSALALSAGLRRLGKRVVVAGTDRIPACYQFLPGADEVVIQPESNWDCVVYIDCAGRERASIPIPPGAVIINIDHHHTNTKFADIDWIDPLVSAVGEQIFILLNELGVALDPDIATCLYVALATDTGSFQYANTTARALAIAARLVEAGAEPYAIAERVFNEKSRAHLALLSRALATLDFSPCGRVAWMVLRQMDMLGAGAVEEDADGIVNYARAARGVKIGVLFRELKPNVIKVGLRGRPGVDVSQVAAAFGGGGHPGAAGCTVDGPIAAVQSRVISACLAAISG